MASTTLDGIPSVRRGIKEVCAAALLADSGAATPFMLPFPKLSGFLDIFFSNIYEEKEASTAPPPGRIPRRHPDRVPLRTAGIQVMNSFLLSMNPVSLPFNISLFSFFSRLFIISEMPNSPMARATNPMPSDNSEIPKQNRWTPLVTSVPTMPSKSPTTIIPTAFMMDPDASTMDPINPKTITEKYSAGPNFRDRSARGMDNTAIISVATHPAKKEPSAAMVSAAPALPCLAIWFPSRQVTTEDASPGRFIRIEVVDPPYCAP